ncbi:MAG: hypothetical protein UT04_C0032G0001, partial [Candidatus Daviesbacteria bacterium GW2011_GWF2_38_7]
PAGVVPRARRPCAGCAYPGPAPGRGDEAAPDRRVHRRGGAGTTGTDLLASLTGFASITP